MVTVEVIIRPPRSVRIILIGLTVIIFVGIIVAAYIAATSFRRAQRRAVNGVVVVVGGGLSGTASVLSSAVSTPFVNQYIRTTSGFWFDNGNGQVAFSVSPKQSWNFDGKFLTNTVSYNSLYVANNGYPMLTPLPAPNTPRTTFIWVFNGTSLIQASSETNRINLVADQGNSPQTGYLQLLQTDNNAAPPTGAIITLSPAGS